MKILTLRRISHYIPIALFALFIVFNYADPNTGLMTMILWIQIIPAVLIWLVFALVQSWKIGGVHRKVIFCAFGFEILAIIMYFLIIVPAFTCDPDKMVKHYEKNKVGMEDLITYTASALNDGQQMYLEFEHGKVSIFNTSTLRHWNVDDIQKSEIMNELGLNDEEFYSIKNQLNSIHCISIDTHFPNYCDIGYKRVAMGLFSYRLYLSPMSDKEKTRVLSDWHFIPYNDTTLFMFEGGAVGPDTFNQEKRDDFLRRHPFPTSN